MTDVEWKSGPITDLLLHTLDIHRARHGAEPSNSFVLRPPHAALRCDLGRKHMLLAFAVVRRYWSGLAPAARQAIAKWEEIEEGERERDPLGDDFIELMDSLIECQNAAKGETAMALWLVVGWWPEVRSFWAGQQLPAGWRPLIDDIFGDAFQSVSFEPSLRTHTPVSLARRIYESRDFGLMPTLADALQDAGCEVAALLNHCRGPDPHVRGCWVVDLVLGKQ